MIQVMIACCLIAQAPALPSDAKVEYDKFHDYTRIHLGLGEFRNEAGTHVLTTYATHDGRTPKAADHVTLHIYRYGPHWEYLKYHDVVIMCGDQRLRIRETRYDSQVDTKDTSGNHCDEFLSIDVAAEDLQKMLGRDRDLEVKIGAHDPFTIGATARGKMSRFVKAVMSGAY